MILALPNRKRQWDPEQFDSEVKQLLANGELVKDPLFFLLGDLLEREHYHQCIGRPFQAVFGPQDSLPTSITLEEFKLLRIEAINAYSGTDLRALPTLFYEFHGSPAGVKEQAEAVGLIAKDHSGGDFQWATCEQERRKLWAARETAYWAARASRPGCLAVPTDVCVPISHLSECIMETRKDLQIAQLQAPLVGHVGDGNFHLLLLLDPNNPDELRRARVVNSRMVARAIEMGGTCTGEHGVGYGKRKYLVAEHGEEVLDLMHVVKAAVDPLAILNPGKLGTAYTSTELQKPMLEIPEVDELLPKGV
ncbi:hypothetical protein CYMTET_44467 [Cymbomonas tetramitiformis]|uniref:D-lactate dehydrogenase (cytochrome) n=1 Tax=Cymbomonas tetramitiformis TaxID=36881 RepID=A0AAE0C1Z1_9CHLO|nr:hypothetical protein CYMTET_44467 [Cymbomonas tetramitiformis]